MTDQRDHGDENPEPESTDYEARLQGTDEISNETLSARIDRIVDQLFTDIIKGEPDEKDD